MKQGTIQREIRRSVLELVGSLLLALGTYNFAVTADIPLTGFTGIAEIIYRLTGFPMGLMTLILNIPVALLCIKTLGGSFLMRSLRCSVFYFVLLDYVMPLFPVYQGDRMLAALCAGVLYGLGDALIYLQNSSTGGVDFVVMSCRVKWPHMSVGNLHFATAFVVIAANGLLFGGADSMIYGLIFTFVDSAVIDRCLVGFNAGKLVLTVTSKGEEVCSAIDRRISRGATIVKGSGGYSKADKQVVLCACSTQQAVALEPVIHEVDNEAFSVVLPSTEVHGKGFHMFSVGKD